jgi:3-deoxy-D-manno-octulosonic-acid transferase
MLSLYKLVVNLAYIVLWPYLAIKRMTDPEEWNHRRVLIPAREKTRCCLFHASSVGEVKVLQRLVAAVRTHKPDMPYCVSTYTQAGYALAKQTFTDAADILYFPIDCGPVLRRFFKHRDFSAVVIVETEIWPYFLDHCRRHDIPVILANGRLSARSARRYRFFRSGLKTPLAVYRKFIMQTKIDSDRIIAIGADPDKTLALGNIKNDRNTDIDPQAKRHEVRHRLGIGDDQTFFIAASTRPGEEETLCLSLKSVTAFPGAMKSLLAPRHLDRLDDVRHILTSSEIDFVAYSEATTESMKKASVILMDKIGLLAELFYGADLAFVGGTLADLGGHNVMEPVLAGVPVLFGPSIYNVRDAAQTIIDNHHGRLINNADELAAAISDVISGKTTYTPMAMPESSVAEQTADIIIRELEL